MQHALARELTGNNLAVRLPSHPRSAPGAPSRALLLFICAAAVLLISPTRPAPAAAISVTTSSDVLLVHPASGVTLGALGAALTELGYQLIDGGEAAGVVRVRITSDLDPQEVAAAIAGSGIASGIEADGLLTTARVAAGAQVSQQLTYLEVIGAPAAWDQTTGDRHTVIALVDSGIDYDHPEFRGRLAINSQEIFGDGLDNDENGCIDDIAGCNFVSESNSDAECNYTRAAPNWAAWDDAGHGTVVAGVAAASGDDEAGIAGMSWHARLLPVKVLDCTGVGRISTAAAGIRYAAERGAHIINISLGSATDSRVLREAVLTAQARGALIVASAGNQPGVVTYPGAYPGVLSVGASGYVAVGSDPDYLRITRFSGSGPLLDLIAPGYLIAGPLPPALCDTPLWACGDGPYTLTSGSSFAAALVAGAAALLRSQHPGIDPPLLTALLLKSAQPPSQGTTAVLEINEAISRPLYRLNTPGATVGDQPTASGLAEN